MKKLTLFFALLLLTSVSLSAQKIPTIAGDTVAVYFSSIVSGAEFGCLTQVQVLPPNGCAGNPTTMTSSLAGGNPLLPATWKDENGNIFATNVSSVVVSPLFTTTYTVEVQCPDGSTSIVNPTVFISGIAPTLNFVAISGICGSAMVDLTVNGGASPYTYVWSNGQNTQDINNLFGGTYSVTVSTSVGCTKTGSVAVTCTPQPSCNLLLANSVSNVTCNGGNNGAVNLTPTNGSGNYGYNWSNGFNSQDPFNLIAGTYTVTVIDLNVSGCSATMSVTVTQPSMLSLTETHINVQCNGNATGSIDLTVSGGTPPYNYQWSNCATIQDLAGLEAGTYCVTVVDANSCSKMLCINVTQSAPMAVPSIQVSYSGGSNVALTATGGSSYVWSNGTPVATTNVSSNNGGTYTVTVTDSNGCTAMNAVTPNITPCSNPCNPPIAAFGFSVNGATASFTNTSVGATSYAWSLGDGLFSNQVNPAHNYSLPGTYTVILTATNSCGTSTSTATVTIQDPPCNLTVATSVMDATCNGCNDGSVWVTPNNGTAPYSYQWSNGANTSDLSNLAVGTYCVTVTDANACTASACVNVNQPPAGCNTTGITNNLGAINGQVFCPPTSQFFLVAPNWGQNGYTFQWSSGGITMDPWKILASTNSGAHYYEVLVTSPSNEEKLYCFSYTVLCLSGTADERGPEPSIFPNPIGDGECLNVTGLPAGMYNVMITDQSGRVVTKKVVKQ